MKRYKNKLIAAVIVVFAIISFTSCENEYYWKDGTLDVNFDVYADRNGYDEIYTTVRIEEIPQFNPSREDLVDLVTKDSWMKLSNLRRGDYIDRFYIEVAGVGRFAYERPISIRDDNAEVIIDDYAAPGFFNFMRDVNYNIYRYGAVDMKITFYSRIYNNVEPIYFDIKSNLDLEVRD